MVRIQARKSTQLYNMGVKCLDEAKKIIDNRGLSTDNKALPKQFPSLQGVYSRPPCPEAFYFLLSEKKSTAMRFDEFKNYCLEQNILWTAQKYTSH